MPTDRLPAHHHSAKVIIPLSGQSVPAIPIVPFFQTPASSPRHRTYNVGDAYFFWIALIGDIFRTGALDVPGAVAGSARIERITSPIDRTP